MDFNDPDCGIYDVQSWCYSDCTWYTKEWYLYFSKQALVSCAFLVILGFYLLLRKHFDHHPYKLIGIVCLYDSIELFNWLVYPIRYGIICDRYPTYGLHTIIFD